MPAHSLLWWGRPGRAVWFTLWWPGNIKRIQKEGEGGWRNDSVLFQRIWAQFPAFICRLTASITPVLGLWHLLLAYTGHCMHMIHINTYRQNTHMYKMKIRGKGLFLTFYLCGCFVYRHLCAMRFQCLWRPKEDIRSWIGVGRQLWGAMCILGTEPGTSRRAAALKCWAMSPARFFFNWIQDKI